MPAVLDCFALDDFRMKKTPGYILIIHFLTGILAVLVLITMFVLINQNNRLRYDVKRLKRDLASCSVIRTDCIEQLGVFYVDPNKHLKGKKYVSDHQ